MPELLLYLLKVNVALVLFYLAYHVALRRLTFYHLNRLFLVFGIVFSTVYPLIDLSELFAYNQPIANAYIVTIPAWALTSQTIAQTPTFDYWQLPVYLFWAGFIVMLGRFIVQFISLYKIHKVSEPANYKSIDFRKATSINHAFSFWQTIYLNPEQHKRDELEQILHHELIHITGWHTLDVLLAELSTVFYWFNPGAWLMKKAVKENLEFIADQNVVNTGVDKKEYQYLLLKVVGATQPQIANQFNFPSLKRRIAMMNKMPTSKANRLRLLIALPLAVTLLFAFRSAAEVDVSDMTGYTKLGPDIYIKQGPTFQSACWTAPNTLTITPVNGGKTENYQLDNKQDIATAISKYGLYLPDNELYEKLTASKPEATKQKNADTENTQGDKLPKELVQHLKKNPAVKSVRGKVVDNRNAVVIGLKGGGTEVYYLDDAKSIAELERKYNLPELPPPPPPAPAAPDAEELPPPPPPVRQEQNQLKAPAGVVYYIDGKEDKSEAYKNLDPKEIHSVNVYKNESAEKVFGKSAAKGVISIITTKNKDSRQVQEFMQKLPALPAPPPPVKELPTPPSGQGQAFIFSPAGNDYYKDNLPEDYIAFLKRNPQVKQVSWKFTDKKEYNLESVVILLKSGKSEEYHFNQNYTIPALEEKYGELPALPAPPPPVKAKSTIDKRESSVTKPVKRNTYAQLDTLKGTAAQIRKVLYERQKAGEPPVDNLILFTKNSKGEGIDVFAKLNGTKIESVKALATAN
ncbi:M56 family metallopeptidase [Pontibacter pudoricolor]|uniref:M56 family metallopeptidase n=1 Tax=Pontibacter pudoricolor TaxID=2694930 RepID=UPI00139200A7|nr:M56 family metallopeptidase [Pontibacter pudoricolor]